MCGCVEGGGISGKSVGVACSGAKPWLCGSEDYLTTLQGQEWWIKAIVRKSRSACKDLTKLKSSR